MGNNGNGASSLIILALPLLLIIWMFWSGSRRQKQMRSFNASLNIGDEVVTSAGIFGTIRHLDDSTVHLEIAEGTIIRLDRRAIATKQADPSAAPGPVTGTGDASSTSGQ